MRRNMAQALLEHERIVTTPAKAKEVRPFVERLITMAKHALPYKDGGGASDRARYLHYYRLVLSRLQDKELVQKLFGEGEWLKEGSLAERYADRPGGYTRIMHLGGSRLGVPVGSTLDEIPTFEYTMTGQSRRLRLTGNRLGDNAPQVVFELVEKVKPAAGEEVAPKISISRTGDGVEPEPGEDEGTEEPGVNA